MKRIFLFLLIINISEVLFSQNYLPLNVGNKWQYLGSGYYSSGFYYSVNLDSVEYDSINNDKVYVKLSKFSDLLRYSSSENKIFAFYDDSEYVFIDLNIPNNNYYQSFGYWHYYANALSINGSHIIFDQEKSYGGIEVDRLPYADQYIFTDSIGLTSKGYSASGMHGHSENWTLIQAILLDSSETKHYFTYHYKPYFEFTPIYTVSSANFILNCKVKHQYNRLNGNPPWNSVNFIDTVKMYCYYSKGDSIGSTTFRIPYHDYSNINPNDDYLFEIQLDTSLLKNGYTFNYKIYAKDKGIIPEHSYAPDSGYYQCNWVEPNDIEIEPHQLTQYILSQNYPNPFNPSTSIEYQIPQSSFVTIKVYDALGKEVVTLVNEEKPAGIHEVNFEPKDLTSGLYLYKIKVGSFEQTRKMIFLK